jgi:hypothetical protein
MRFRLSIGSLIAVSSATVFFLAASLHGQITTAEVTGTVTDTSGAVVAGATVTITNPATNTPRVTQTNTAGVFDVPSLPPGTYNVKIEMTGFTTQVRNNLELQVAQVARVDVGLQVGNVSEVVEVSANAAQLETESTAVGTVIEERRIVDLPINGRNYLLLTTLAPGVTTTQTQNAVVVMREGGTRALFTLSIAGQRLFYNHYTLDGLENTDPNFQTYMFLPSVDALQEFKVESGIFPAEYGHNIVQINVTTKSGGNQFHGVAFDFLRNSAFDAKNFFDSHTSPIPPFRRNQFGGTLGGAIVKNKLFFFGDYEGLRQLKALSLAATVAPASWLQGDFTGTSTIYDPTTRVLNAAGTSVISSTPFQNNKIPANRITSEAMAYIKAVLPVVSAFGNNNFLSAPSEPLNGNQQQLRLDYNISSNQTLMARFSHASEAQYVPQNIPNTGSNTATDSYQDMLGHTWVISPTKVNELRLGISHFVNNTAPEQANKTNLSGGFGIPNLVPPNNSEWGVTALSFGAGLTGPGSPSDAPFINWDTVIQSADNFSWNHGSHAFKFGGEVNRTRFNQLGAASPNGTFGFGGIYTTQTGTGITAANYIADFLLGDMTSDAYQVGVPVGLLRSTYIGTYFQDTWKISSKLTVNYGLRWEYQQPWSDKYDHIVNVAFNWNNSFTPYYVRAGTGDPLADAVPPPHPAPAGFLLSLVRNGQFGNTNIQPDHNNWGPRAGVAYSLNSKTVIRAGAGLYYVHDFQNAQFDTVRNAPFSFRGSQTSTAPIPNLTWNTAIVPVPGFILVNQWGEPTTRVYEWSFGVQRSLSNSATLEATYIGSAGNYLERFASYNTPQPGPGNAQLNKPFPTLSGTVQVLNSSDHSSYEALQVKFTQRLSHGFTLLSSYTYGKSLDGGSAAGRGGPGDTQTPPNPYNCLNCSRGLSSFSYKMRWTDSLLYNLPVGKGQMLLGNAGKVVNALAGGWQLGTIFTWQGGLPDSATCQSSSVQNTIDTCYPDTTGIKPGLGSAATPNDYWNPAAFVDRLPGGPTYRYGNSGRDTLIGPGLVDWDFSMLKTFAVTERQSVQLRGEVFNLANHPLFGMPNAQRGGAFGVISNTIVDSRQFQIAFKYIF